MLRGDFFKDVPVQANAYVMRWVLHDWSDEESVALLAKLKKATRSDARLMVVESVIPETPIDLPVVSHVTRATVRDPFLGMMLTLDARSILQLVSEMDEPRLRREDAYRAISFKALDGALLDALVRLVELLDEPTLVP